MTVSQFNPVTWSAKAGARSPPDYLDSLAAPPAGSLHRNPLADDSKKPANPNAKGQV